MVNFWKKTKYLDAVGDAFASYIDYAQLQEIDAKDGNNSIAEKKYGPAECIGCKKTVISGDPDPVHIFNQLCRKTEFDDENAHAEIYPVNKCFL
jgi:hypothetical protein